MTLTGWHRVLIRIHRWGAIPAQKEKQPHQVMEENCSHNAASLWLCARTYNEPLNHLIKGIEGRMHQFSCTINKSVASIPLPCPPWLKQSYQFACIVWESEDPVKGKQHKKRDHWTSWLSPQKRCHFASLTGSFCVADTRLAGRFHQQRPNVSGTGKNSEYFHWLRERHRSMWCKRKWPISRIASNKLPGGHMVVRQRDLGRTRPDFISPPLIHTPPTHR